MRTIAFALLFGVAQAPPAFETASVKPNPSPTCDRDGSMAGGRFIMTCATLRELMIVGYPRDKSGRSRADNEFAGGPSWQTTDRFDITAKVPEGRGTTFDTGNTAAASMTASQASAALRIREMLQPLLAERFKLAVHHETRNLPVYELRMDRKDGGPGPRLKKVDGTPRGFKTMGPGHFVGSAATLAMLAQFLEPSVSRNVIDRTGLQGAFDLELEYAPTDPAGVSVFTALKEQLGLKLESTKAPIDVLVIDHADKPTPD